MLVDIQNTLERIATTVGQRVAPRATDKYQSEVETDRLDAHFEMATAAMIGGLTQCATIASGVGFPHFSITFNGL
ncbi:unnamed protein product, partial [marine sediment metagenome]